MELLWNIFYDQTVYSTMPICTTCTNFIPYLYTVYESAYNLRLEQCVRATASLLTAPKLIETLSLQPKCHSFADPYVEHDSLTLLLDLILLKRGVYRHLLYNRGTEPRKLLGRTQPKSEDSTSPESTGREMVRWAAFRLPGASFDA